MSEFIPQITPWIDESELEILQQIIASTYVTEHNLTRKFEEQIAHMTGSRHAIAVSNGTIAQYCGLLALGLEPDDEVIVPDLTFVATANAIIMAGGRPVFVDVDRATFCLDPKLVEEAITPRTRGICPVHLYGLSADMDAILEIARRRGLWVLEDAAQGVGVRWNGKHTGTFGQLGFLSFYGNKTITTGEGGVILTDDDDLATACYRLKNHGRDRKGTFVHDHIGFNFSFTEMQAAIGLSQLKKLGRIIQRKHEIYLRYREGLDDLCSLTFPEIPSQVTPVYWFTSIMVENPAGLGDYLACIDIQTRRFFYPLHLQPCYKDRKFDTSPRVNSRWVYDHGISLPASYALTNEDQDRIIEAIRKYYDS